MATKGDTKPRAMAQSHSPFLAPNKISLLYVYPSEDGSSIYDKILHKPRQLYCRGVCKNWS